MDTVFASFWVINIRLGGGESLHLVSYLSGGLLGTNDPLHISIRIVNHS